MANQVISGARAILKIGDEEIGYATGVQASEQIDYQPIEQLGEVDVITYEPTARRITMSCSMLRILDVSQLKNLFPASGPNTTADVLDFEGMTAEVINLHGDKTTLYKFEGVKSTSRNFTLDRGGIMMLNANFVATRMLVDNS